MFDTIRRIFKRDTNANSHQPIPKTDQEIELERLQNEFRRLMSELFTTTRNIQRLINSFNIEDVSVRWKYVPTLKNVSDTETRITFAGECVEYIDKIRTAPHHITTHNYSMEFGRESNEKITRGTIYPEILRDVNSLLTIKCSKVKFLYDELEEYSNNQREYHHQKAKNIISNIIKESGEK